MFLKIKFYCTISNKLWLDTWNAVVQARQKAIHKRTFYYLEQLILKNNAHSNTLNILYASLFSFDNIFWFLADIKDQTDGLDFFFQTRSNALKFIDFLQAVTPIRFKTSEHLVSHDEHSNTYLLQHIIYFDWVWFK